MTTVPVQSNSSDYTPTLQQWMEKAGVPSFRALSRAAEVSRWQVNQLRRGHADQMRVAELFRLSQVLQVSLPDLIATFAKNLPDPASSELIEQASAPKAPQLTDSTALQQEYQRLQTQLEQQRDRLYQAFQQESLEILESWLLQWPTAAYAAQQNPQVPAVRLLPLVRPVEQLLEQWGITAIAPVGSEVPYDPQQHQLMEGTAQPGDRVRVRYTGYHQGEKLLHRAKVSPIV